MGEATATQIHATKTLTVLQLQTSEWTVSHWKQVLSQQSIPLHHYDNKAKLFQLFTVSQQNITLPL